MPLHGRLSDCFKQYLVVGGMPESISTFIETGSYLDTDRVKQSILTTYLDDFAKYRKRIDHSLLETVFKAQPVFPVRLSSIRTCHGISGRMPFPPRCTCSRCHAPWWNRSNG